ncbi:hypothetical protein DSO57_1034277 [Entomophthora muscae]|uniref:Uncharacterized protein n=1 Tax=Entomophthora muscae TaxID=34485 RepID=A0ACC2TYL9_9FUNG|nr:hypothetical protein DSO57_1034277 [Entomophthora muscae]
MEPSTSPTSRTCYIPVQNPSQNSTSLDPTSTPAPQRIKKGLGRLWDSLEELAQAAASQLAPAPPNPVMEDSISASTSPPEKLQLSSQDQFPTLPNLIPSQTGYNHNWDQHPSYHCIHNT